MFGEKTIQSSTITGTGSYTLDASVGAFKTWRSQKADASVVFYFAENGDGTIWEAGYGTLTYGSPDTISRTLVLSSTGSLISWVAGDAPIYVQSTPSAVASNHLVTGGLATARPAWLQAGGAWLDYALGLGTTWIKKRWTGAASVEEGRLDIASGIFIASNAAPIRDTTTSGSTIGVNDRGFIVSHDTAAAVRTAALPAVATAGEGFYVGIYADGIFPVFLDTSSTEAVDCAVVPPGQLVWVRCTGTKWLTQGDSNQALIGRRQTVTAGPLSSGAPNLLATVSGLPLSTSNVAAATPLIVRASNGDFERWGLSTGNVSFGTLTNTTTNYLYVTVGVDGVLTGGFTTLAPIYQESGTPATTSGQYTFNIGEMKGYLGNGSTAPAVYLVFVGEAVTSGGNVTAVTAYAYNGRYDSGYTATLPNADTATAKSHNVGVVPRLADFRAQCSTTDAGYAVGDEIGMGSMWTDDGSVNTPFTLAAGRLSGTVILSTNIDVMHISTGARTALTRASWKWRQTYDRGW
jgi:3D (Asp-Asp-Asp) domain-containing protein